MTPTMKLRFVERDIGGKYVDRVRVLQQWWEERDFICDVWIGTNGEWRDVPLETEE